mmetsp:Transcript_19181/g.31794  ORF Transcript_19181/g.31794 Transcript_19181/m.31794 type:complete len:245 (-) Transcript_19181:540-1274(-)
MKASRRKTDRRSAAAYRLMQGIGGCCRKKTGSIYAGLSRNGELRRGNSITIFGADGFCVDHHLATWIAAITVGLQLTSQPPPNRRQHQSDATDKEGRNIKLCRNKPISVEEGGSSTHHRSVGDNQIGIGEPHFWRGTAKDRNVDGRHKVGTGILTGRRRPLRKEECRGCQGRLGGGSIVTGIEMFVLRPTGRCLAFKTVENCVERAPWESTALVLEGQIDLPEHCIFVFARAFQRRAGEIKRQF